MVVDGDRRVMRPGRPAAGHDRIAPGLDDLCLCAKIGQHLYRHGRHAPDVVGPRGVHADRRNLDHLAEQIFKSCATACDESFELLLIHGHDGSSWTIRGGL